MRVPFVVGADFETCTKPISDCEPDNDKSFTRINHVGLSHRLLRSMISFIRKSQSSIGHIEWVWQCFSNLLLEDNIKSIHREFNFKKKTILSDEDRRDFKQATHYWLCKGLLNDERVRDRCHFTRKYRGAAHFMCSLQSQKPKLTPVIFHTLAGYDFHLFVKNLGKAEGRIKCIPYNE